MSPIQMDGATENNLSIEDATDALLKKWSDPDEDANEPSDESEPDKDNETEQDVEDEEDSTDEDAEELSEEDDEDENSETDEDEEADEKPKSKKQLTDTEIVKVKVAGEELEVPVEKLKRLYGQEAALTQKSQAVAAKAKEAEELGARYVTALEQMMRRAQERAEPFAKIDWLVAAKNLSEDELVALRNEASRHIDDVKFYEQELNQFMGQVQQQRHQQLQAQARECVEVLKKEIPGWNQKVYDDIRGFAIDTGLAPEVVNNLVDPAAFKMLHMAMLYKKGQTASTKKVVKAPKKIVKTTVSAETTKQIIKNKNTDNATNRLQKSGSIDDATEAFLARWQAEDN
jgi:hypothetical protein